MNIKSEDEIKVEELNPEYDFSEQSFQDLNDDNENHSPSEDIKYEDKFALPENIKNEELDQKVFETGLEELKYESMSSEDQVDENDINSEIIEKSSSIEHANKFMSLRNVSSLLRKINEKGSEVYFESDEEFFFAELVASKFPLVLLTKWSDEELKILLDGEYENGSKVSSTFRSRSQKNIKMHSMNHLRTHEEKKFFKCSDCSYTCSNKEYLQLHVLTHNHTKLFKCLSCSYRCNSKIDLENHILKHRYVKSLKCSLCNFRCKKKNSLEIHMLTHAEKLFKCSDCTYRCKRKDMLHSHMLTHGKKLFKCSECKHETNHEENFKKHMLYHQNIKLYKCPDCAFETNYKSSLNSHQNREHKKHLYKCSECNYESYYKGGFKKHMLYHRNIKLYKCSECNFETNYKDSLTKHEQSRHKNVSKCFESNDKYDDRTNLMKLHMIKHSNILYKCPKCSYETNWKNIFGRHMGWHEKKPEQFNSYAFVKKKLALSGKEKN